MPLIVPGSVATIPLNVDIPIDLPLGRWKIPLPAHFTLESITLDDLNKFKTLRPAKLLNGNFTWGGDVALRETTATLDGKLVVLGKVVNVTAAVLLSSPSLHFETIVAFNRTKLCEVWGLVMKSSASCALWPMMLRPSSSGLNVTSLKVNLTDFAFNLTVSGLGPLDKLLQQELTAVVHKLKPKILATLPTLDAHMARNSRYRQNAAQSPVELQPSRATARTGARHGPAAAGAQHISSVRIQQRRVRPQVAIQ